MRRWCVCEGDGEAKLRKKDIDINGYGIMRNE